MLISTLRHVSHFWCPYLVMYNPVVILTWLCIPILIFTLSNVSSCWYSHLIISPMLIVTLGNVSPCCFSHIIIYPHVDIHSWSYITMLIFTLGYVSSCSYLQLVMDPSVAILTWSVVPMWIFTPSDRSLVLIFYLDYVSPFCYSYVGMHSSVGISTLNTCVPVYSGSWITYWYSQLVIYPSVDILTW